MTKYYYFAYGSNMSHKQMKVRCPDSIFIRRSYLNGFKFVYDGYSNKRKGAVANIVEDETSIVWGGLYEISDKDLENLDKFEGYPNIYDRKYFNIILDNDEVKKAIAYFRTGKETGVPSVEYRDIVLLGAKECKLPENYIKIFIEDIRKFEVEG